MKKLFLLIPVLALSLLVNAKTTTIGPDDSDVTVNNQLISALGSAEDGEVIILTDGIYNEASDYVVFSKNVEVRAAEGANPLIKVVNYLKVEGGKHVIINGLTFDGSAQGSRDQYFRFYTGNNILEVINCTFTGVKKNIFRCESGNKFSLLDVKNCTFTGSLSNVMRLESNLCGTASFDGCEFSNTADVVIQGESTSHLDECIVNDCYFHNNAQQSIYFKASETGGTETCDELTITNSTFANTTALTNWISVIDIRPNSSTNTIKVTVDHCTFYNNPTVDDGHANIRTKEISDVTVSNSIFAHPEAYARRATYCTGGGNINNCLTYNYTASGTKGHAYGCTVNAASSAGDPLFNDLANNKYTYDGNWSTGSISPARGAATDGTDLGDPRWYSAETLPSTSFASTYDLLSTKAQLAGNIRLNANSHIEYYDNSVCGTATWKMHVDRLCAVQAVVDMETGSSSGSIFKLMAYDEDGNKLDSATCAYKSDDDDILLSGQLYFPTAGDYKLRLFNEQSHSSAKVEKITISYSGGAVQNIATDANTTLNVADALFTSGFTRANGQVSPGSWKPTGQPLGYVKWNIATPETKFYDLTLNFSSTNAHSMAVNIYEDEGASPIATISESYTSTTGALTISDRISLAGGKNYVVKVTNPTSGSEAKVTSVVFAPVVATTTSLPNTLEFSNALLSEKAHITDGMLYFNVIADTDPRGQWARWNVSTDHAGLFLFTMSTTSSNGQNYKISILDDGENVIDSYETTSLDSGDKTIKHYFQLAAGDYSVKVENTRSYSKGHLVSLVVTEPDDVITIDETATAITSWEGQKDVANVDVKILRSLKGGMYNTLVLPFAISSHQAKEIFGESVEMYTLKEATVEDDYILNLQLKSESSTYQGTPIFVKPAHDVENPIFIDVTILTTSVGTTTKTNANFAGSFVKTTLGPDQDVLFLAQDNMLYYPAVDIEVLGMRGWFVIHDTPAPAPQITRARIINNEHVATEIELVGNTLPTEFGDNLVTKRIDDGQLLIIRDGAIYNALGVRIK